MTLRAWSDEESLMHVQGALQHLYAVSCAVDEEIASGTMPAVSSSSLWMSIAVANQLETILEARVKDEMAPT